ncbi:MAG: helix-turn-helix domain-containing protein [Erysipelotrichaceae bacterium]|nr:helix-turn-helix domain-containing protein [Erysipelotrichaceae bacterium]
MNYLPSKLLKLRKHYNYSQAHLAELLKVDVMEYMAYENGRKIPSYEECQTIANLYHISIDEIIKNSDEVTLYNVSSSRTDEINIEYFLPKKNFFDYLKEFVKNHGILVGTTIGVVLLGLLVIGLFTNKEEIPYSLNLLNINRLSVSETTVVYIYGDGAVKGSGDNSKGQLSNLPSSNAIKVGEGSDFTIILNSDGTVSYVGLDKELEAELKQWHNIIDIAAGDKHIVGVDQRGYVFAIGDNSFGQCEVSSFKNIKKVYATKNATIVLDNEGILSSTGEFIGSSKIQSFANVIDLDASDDNLVVLDENGSVEYIAKNKNFLNIYKWQNVVDVCCGDNFVAALLKDGSVVVDCDDEKITKQVSKWENIIAIDAGNDYLIAYDGEKIYGVGKNDYQQFEGEAHQEILAQVTNVKIAINDTIDVTFDSVEGASGYELRLNAGEGNVKKVSSNQIVSFFSDGLENGNNYQITITALGDGEYYLDSDPLMLNFTYIKEEKNNEEEYVDINVNFTDMDEEQLKEYLNSIGISNIICVETASPCEEGGHTIISVDGISSGQRIAKRDLAKAMVTYYTCKIPENEGVDNE